MEEQAERKHAAKIYNEEVEPALNKLYLLYAVSSGSDNIIGADWNDPYKAGIQGAVTDILEDAIKAIKHFSNVVLPTGD